MDMRDCVCNKGVKPMEKIKKPLPIGVDNFEKIIEENYYYIDKTLLIKELLDKKGEVTLFTRPRRFGKTLNLSMLRYFFGDTGDKKLNEKHRCLFEGLNISDAGKEYTDKMCAYPVVFLTLKSAKQKNYEIAYNCLKEVIAREFRNHMEIIDSLNAETKQKYIRISEEKASEAEMGTALAFLSECLYVHYNKKTIILIDEYDVPLENSYFNGFYDDMTSFLRSLFESALKTNDYLEFAVITSCLRISKESIFTGLNHLKIISILENNFAEYFGFEPNEVEKMLEFYGVSEKIEVMKKWYDGYLFGKSEVYNPWSVINYMELLCSDAQAYPKPYWSNTSSNDIVRSLVERADEDTKDEIEQLIAGGTIEKPIHGEITYNDIYKTSDNLWNFLFFTGYLKKVSERKGLGDNAGTIYLTMKIPNIEIRYIYNNSIIDWFNEEISKKDFHDLYEMMDKGDTEQMRDIIEDQLLNTISFYDSAESFYHGFMVGLLNQNKKYRVKSNRESGNGRGDIFIYTQNRRKRAYILELKVSEKMQYLENDAKKALEQVKDRDYAAELRETGFSDIVEYGIAFYRKNCEVFC